MYSLADYDYDLPEELIAQEPLVRRDAARLLIVRRAAGSLEHGHVRDLPALLAPGDLVVLNDTKVLPARLLGVRERTGGKWEGLYLRTIAGGLWEMMTQTRGQPAVGEWIRVDPLHEGGPALRLRLVRKIEGYWLAEPEGSGPAEELLVGYGHVPLPPYIRKGQDQPADRERYQTVFAQRPGAVAAPTAGLHFTPELLQRLGETGINQARVTLHVGVGTFQPVKSQDIREHQMHAEWAELPAATAAAIRHCRAGDGRVVAVGTTAVRVLETVAAAGPIQAWCGETRLFIHPPYAFRAVDALLTNFHLPRSSLLMLVSAFAGLELIRRAYQVAVAAGYRFYSYGDAMLII